MLKKTSTLSGGGEDAEAAQLRAYKRKEFEAAALVLAEG